jgi:hypothetical protein
MWKSVMLPTLIACFFVVPAAAAQPAAGPDCPGWAFRGPADVTMRDGRRLREAIRCLETDAVVVERGGVVTRVPIDGVRRITTPADPIWDGAAKGASIPLVFFLVFCHDCKWGETMTRMLIGYTALGVSWDALQTNRRTVYEPGRQLRPTLTATFRF